LRGLGPVRVAGSARSQSRDHAPAGTRSGSLNPKSAP
jgi:hypothetical protein